MIYKYNLEHNHSLKKVKVMSYANELPLEWCVSSVTLCNSIIYQYQFSKLTLLKLCCKRHANLLWKNDTFYVFL